MEEVDQIILHSLLGIGCEFAEGLKSLKQLSTENVVEGAVKCIRIINPDFKMSHIFPPGMSARFRVGTSIAQACQSLGYRGEIGYQTFLYSSEVDIRKFFMFLIEKLPRKEGITEDTGSSTVLQRRIGQVLRDQSRLMWLPPYCKLNKTDTIPFRTETIIVSTYKKGHESGTPFVHEQICERCHLSQSLMELNIQQLLKAQSTQSKTVKTTFTKKGTAKESFQWRHKSMQEDRLDLTASFEDVIKDLSVGGKHSKRSRFVHTQQLQFSEGDVVKSLRPAIPKKPQKLKKPEPDAKSGDSSSSKTKVTKTEENDVEDVPDKEIEEPDETEEEGQQRKESQLTEALKVLELKQVEYKSEIGSMESSLKQMKIEINELKQATDETEKTIDVQKKTCMLLPNADENMEKLKKLIEKNSQRLLNLARMWEEKRVPLINELRGLRDKTNISEDDTQMKLEEIKLIRKKMKESSDETKRKELIIKQLTVELESMKRDISRQSYTKRILEIVTSIHKQQEEIGRVISEIKDVQKQINKMKGRIDRTFTAVDEAMFKDAKKDEHVRQAYKHLVALHDNCSELLRTVDETGSILREIRELEDQIETESDKNAEENLAKIMKDYKEIKKENADLIKKIRKQ